MTSFINHYNYSIDHIILALLYKGLDVVGPFKPSFSCSCVFMRAHLIYVYEFLCNNTSYNIFYYKNEAMIRLAENYKFEHYFSSSYNSSSNGEAEAFNKMLCKIEKKMDKIAENGMNYSKKIYRHIEP